MRSLRCFALALLVVSPTALAQSIAEENQAIQAALRHQFSDSLPYVERWAVSKTTEPLSSPPQNPPIDAEWADYQRRNAQPIELTSVVLLARAVFADLSRFTQATGFDWSAFEHELGAGTWTARVSRPGFSDASHAVVRIDVWNSVTAGVLSTAVYLVQKGGEWHVQTSVSPPVPLKALRSPGAS